MNEHPIIFSTDMVLAILAGTKTQTRRVVRGGMEMEGDESGAGLRPTRVCPYGLPGDHLWVRETWRCEEIRSGRDGVRFAADNAFRGIKNTYQAGDLWTAKYTRTLRWQSPRYMPRWASRMNLEICTLHIRHLQNITEAEAKAEGIQGHTINVGPHYNPTMEYPAFPDKDGGFMTARQAFEALWDSINSKRGYPWDSNPWVWVIEFKKL